MRILLAVLGIIIVLLLIPVGAKFSYCADELTLSLRYLLWHRTLVGDDAPKTPEKKKSPAGKSARKKKSGDDGGKKLLAAIKQKPAGELLSLLCDTISRCCGPIRRLLRRTSLVHFSLSLTVVGRDAADTALRYGRYQCVIPTAIAVLDRTVRLRAERIDIIPGFYAPEEKLSVSGTARLCPAAVLAVAVNLALIALFAFIRLGKIPNKNTSPAAEGKEV